MNAGYLLIEYIENDQGEMLSNTWHEKRLDARLRTNFFQDLSRILLSIIRIPLTKVGSFAIDHGGFLRLKNRPLSLEIQELENEEIPTNMPRDYTYSTVDSYVTDTLRIHGNRLRHQPNAINDTGDLYLPNICLGRDAHGLPIFLQIGTPPWPFYFHTHWPPSKQHLC